MYVREHIYTVFAWISGIILVLGVLLNGLVCAMFLKYRSLFIKGGTMMFSMALSDLLCCAIAVPTSLVSNINKKWMFKDSGCKGHAFVVTWCGVVSITHLAAMAYDRYKFMAFGQDNVLRGRRVVYVVLALWAYSFIFAIAPVAGWSRFTTEGIGTSCSVDWQSSDAGAVSYTVFIFAGCFGTPFGVILYSYYKIYKAVRGMSAAAGNNWENMPEAAKESAKAEVKMAVLLCAMIIAFLLAWTPYATVSLISACGGSHWIGPVAASVPAYLAKSANLYNPVLYFLMYKRFRTKVFKQLNQCREAIQPNVIYPQ